MTVEIPLSRGLAALVDDADVDLLLRTSWYAIPGSYTWYAARGVRRHDGRWTTQLMHKVLTGWPRTDHINGQGLDNRRANLRPATTAENVSNMRKHRGSSRFKGVCWSRREQRWRATIELDGRQAYLGVFREEEAAAQAYDAAARNHFGQFAALNFPGVGEGSAIGELSRRLRRSTTEWRRKLRTTTGFVGGVAMVAQVPTPVAAITGDVRAVVVCGAVSLAAIITAVVMGEIARRHVRSAAGRQG